MFLSNRIKDKFNEKAESLVDRIRTTIDENGNEVMTFKKSAVATLICKSMEEALKIADEEKETHDMKIGIKLEILSFVGEDFSMVDRLCAEKAIEVIDGLPDEIIEKIYCFYPEGNGTITFQWANDESGGRLSLNVGNDTMTYYYKKGRIKNSICINRVPINNNSIRVLDIRMSELFS